MRSEKEFLNEVYARAQIERAKTRARRKHALLALVLLLVAVPALFAMRSALRLHANDPVSYRDTVESVIQSQPPENAEDNATLAVQDATGAFPATEAAVTEAAPETAAPALTPLPRESYAVERVLCGVSLPAAASALSDAGSAVLVKSEAELEAVKPYLQGQAFGSAYFETGALLVVLAGGLKDGETAARALRLYFAGAVLTAALPARETLDETQGYTVILVRVDGAAASGFTEARVLFSNAP